MGTIDIKNFEVIIWCTSKAESEEASKLWPAIAKKLNITDYYNLSDRWVSWERSMKGLPLVFGGYRIECYMDGRKLAVNHNNGEYYKKENCYSNVPHYSPSEFARLLNIKSDCYEIY